MTERDLLQALLDGKKIRQGFWNPEEYIHLQGARLVDEKGEPWLFGITDFKSWKIYKDPKDPKNWIGKLCCFWDSGIETIENIGFLAHYDDKESCPFQKSYGISWKHCRPITKKELENYFVKEN